ncbi:hypothetical protein D9X30_0989 [Cupriavidus sp. U2]|nr:hypothetical protein D9X30_0989 [Cupriavidus sp. U2]
MSDSSDSHFGAPRLFRLLPDAYRVITASAMTQGCQLQPASTIAERGAHRTQRRIFLGTHRDVGAGRFCRRRHVWLAP